MKLLVFFLFLIPFSIRTQVIAEPVTIPVRAPTAHEIIFNTLLKHGVDTVSAKILVAQASFESGYFRNPLTKNSNNPFALLHNPRRKTLAFGGEGKAEGRSGYAEFKCLADAAEDFVYFLEYRKVSHPKEIGIYAEKLKEKRYYGSSADLYAKG
ncbi:MAG: glucosaminidase domain-containing protein, partial [Sphaerospermopsis sp.]|nr:glucosaminidase domain-containing protein [Sphaerospermopsis sp.]